MARYWIAVASRNHVHLGIAGGFAQVCHGKCGPLKRMAEGDWIIYYSPVEEFGGKKICRRFTAIGKVASGDPYEYAMSPDFVPWRRDVVFIPSHDVEIEPLLDQLSFISNKQRWGLPFRAGFFEVPESDFHIISQSMKMAHDT